jgi:hypothetical protein
MEFPTAAASGDPGTPGVDIEVPRRALAHVTRCEACAAST